MWHIHRVDCLRICLVLLVAFVSKVGHPPLAAADDTTPPAIKTDAEVVYLYGGQDSTIQFGKQSYEGLLGRELFRQAFLLAAREELSCVTRDVHLGQLPPQDPCHHLDLVTVAGKSNRIEILSGVPPRQSVLGKEPLMVGDQPDLVAVLKVAEALSRGNFVRQLQTAGVKGESRRWNDLAELPAEVAGLLNEMSFVTQWRAACILHAHIINEGQSPAAYAALVRAYANLGVLTELHWHATNKVFKSRALLYAERLVASGRTPALALESRAYALLLAGFPLAAVADLDAADKSPPDAIARTAKLSALMRAFAAFDHDQLVPAKQPAALRETTILFGYLAREYSLNAEQHLAAADSAIEAIPHCYRINSYLAHEPELGVGHSATTDCFYLTGSTLYARLLKIPELPPGVILAVNDGLKAVGDDEADFEMQDEFTARGKLINALRIAHEPIGEQHELTWPVLGHLIGDHSFGEVIRRTRFLRFTLAASADEWIDESKPLYAGHSYAMLIELLRFKVDDKVFETACAQASHADIDFLELGAHQFMYSPGIHASRQARLENQMDRHMDFTATDQARMLHKYFHDGRNAAAKMFALWPQSSVARSGMIKWHWGQVKQELPKWKQWIDEDPELLLAMGGSLFREKKHQEAVDVLERACKLAPSPGAYAQLAICYQVLQQDENWIRTLKAALKLEDRGLEHARLNSQIANYYCRNRDYRSALPYAEAAAESYSAGGLQLAAEVHEALRNFEQAEAYRKAASQRYNSLDWYHFTRRNDVGDAAGALAFTKEMLTLTLGQRANPVLVVQFSILTDDHEQVVKALEPIVKEYPLETALHGFLALSLDELGRKAQRDEVLKAAVAGNGKLNREQLREILLYDLIELLQKDLVAGGKAEFTPEAIEVARKGALKDDNGKFMFEYQLGRYLELHGKPEEAKKLYFRAWAQEPNENIHRHLSGHRLQKMGVKLSEHKTEFQKQLEAGPKPGAKNDDKK